MNELLREAKNDPGVLVQGVWDLVQAVAGDRSKLQDDHTAPVMAACAMLVQLCVDARNLRKIPNLIAAIPTK